MFRTSAAMLVLFVCSILGQAQQAPAPPAQERNTQPDSRQPIWTPRVEPLKIALKTSRPQAPSDASFGVVVEIENVSDRPVYLRALTLILPPEVDPYNSYASFWRMDVPGVRDAPREINANIGGVLQPGSRTLSSVNLLKGSGRDDDKENEHSQSPLEKGLSAVRRRWQLLQFVPGDYTLRLVCTYWTDRNQAENNSPSYSTQLSETTLPVVAAQTTVLAGAAIGGLMAFILLPSLWLPVTARWSKLTFLHKSFVVLRGASVSCLLSVMVSILLSRMSDSTFLIKVSVQDFWGAITIGFIAGASGTTVLQKFSIWQAEKQQQLVQRGLAPSTEPDSIVNVAAEETKLKGEEGLPKEGTPNRQEWEEPESKTVEERELVNK